MTPTPENHHCNQRRSHTAARPPSGDASPPPADHRPLTTDPRALLPFSVLHAALDILAEEWQTDL